MTALEIVSDFSLRLNQAGIRHLVGGSIASGVWGDPRQTNDADLEVWLNPRLKDAFLRACSDPYYVSATDVDHELVSGEEYRHVQVMEMVEVFKLDCFLVSGEFASQGMDRAIRVRFGSADLPVASGDYILLRKLRWFELGNRVSDRQWSDILGLVRVQKGNLDTEWLRIWAEQFGVTALLEQALDEAQ